MIGWWVFATAVGAPEPSADPSNVTVEVIGPRWRVVVQDRVLEVPEPQTVEERDLVEALIESLLAELTIEIPDSFSLPPLRVRPAPPLPTAPVVPIPRPEPPPVSERPAVPERLDLLDPPELPDLGEPVALPEPEAPEPSPPPRVDPPFAKVPATPVRPPPVAPTPPPMPVVTPPPEPSLWQVWVAPRIAGRPRWTAGLEGSLGVDVGRRMGARLRLGGRLARSTPFAEGSEVVGFDIEGAFWRRFGPVEGEIGGGASWRRYSLDEEPVTTHTSPIAGVALGVPVMLGAWRIAPWLGVGTDLARTTILLPGDDATVSPVRWWTALRIGRGGRR